MDREGERGERFRDKHLDRNPSCRAICSCFKGIELVWSPSPCLNSRILM